MSIFNRNKKKQLETEWQVVEQGEGESIWDAVDRAMKQLEGLGPQVAKGEIRQPPTDGQWLMQAALQRLSMRQTAAGLEAVRQARKVGLN